MNLEAKDDKTSGESEQLSDENFSEQCKGYINILIDKQK